MINLASCLIPFMLHAATPRQTDAYLRAVPQSASMVACIPDVTDLMETAGESTWYRFLDRECIQGGWDSWLTEGDGSDLEAFIAALEPVVSVAFWVVGGSRDPGTRFGVVTQLDALASELEAFAFEKLSNETDVIDVVEVDGVSIRLLPVDDGKFTALYTCYDTFVIQGGEEREALMGHVEETVRALADPNAQGIEASHDYTVARDGASGADLALYIDLPKVMANMRYDPIGGPLIDEIMEDLRSCYAAAWLGSGQDLELRLDLHYGTENALADALELVEPASDDLLRLVPQDSLMVAAMGLDIEGMIELVLDLMDETGKLSVDDAKAAMDAFAEQSGVHILDDFLRLLTGDVVGFVRDEPAAEEELAGAVLIGLTRGDDFLDGFESLLSALGLDDAVETDEYGGADVYTFSGDLGFTLHATITGEFLAVCLDEADLHHVIDAFEMDDMPSIFDSQRFATGLQLMSQTPSYRLDSVSSGIVAFAAGLRGIVERERLEGADGMLEFLTDSFDDAEVIASYFPGLFAYSLDSADGVTTLRFETL
ncbi:MAG: hypothetical protein ACI8QZ_002727 [Chlamydiales bacterium]|jgi:hypothetical protein